MLQILWSSLFVLLNSSLTAQAQTQESEAKKCIPTNEALEIAAHFTQFKRLLDPSKTQVCESDVGSSWFLLLEGLNLIKKMRPFPLAVDSDDAFTLKPLGDLNLWDYLIKRIDRFGFPKQCDSSIGAYVDWDNPGVIHACPAIFKNDRVMLSYVLLHEARHYDFVKKNENYKHSKCLRGPFKGRYACDVSIQFGGSYAAGLYAAVVMGLDRQNLSPLERLAARQLASTDMEIRFQETPKTKVRKSLILVSQNDEIFVWNPERNTLDLVLTLNQPTMVAAGFGFITFYPRDGITPAYRKTANGLVPVKTIGAFAETYNASTNKSELRDVDYSSDGALLQGQTLFTFCNEGLKSLKKLDFASASMISIDDRTHIKRADGSLMMFKCPSKKTGTIKITKSKLRIPRDLMKMTKIDETYYGILDSGFLGTVTRNKNEFEFQPLVNSVVGHQRWKQIFSFVVPEIFVEPLAVAN